MRRTCIIVSPYFPPSTLAGVHRARHLAKHLPAAGWIPIVLCVNEAHHEERLDPGLAALVPSDTEVVKVSALPARVTRLFGVGEISLRAWRPLRLALLRLVETRRPDIVLFTGSPYYPMLLAHEIKRRYRLPIVLDFQDPWVSRSGALQHPWSKRGLSHRLATWLEPRAIRAASYVTSVSKIQNDEMAARYPWLDQNQMTAIPIGGDPQDYHALRGISSGDGGAELKPGFVNLSYVGTIWPGVIDTVRTVLRAAAWIREHQPATYKRIRINFVGTTANPNDGESYRVIPLAEAEGVADIVHEVPRRLPYLQAMSIQANSDGILMLGSDEPHYTASKIFAALMSGRPFLSIFHRASSAHEILRSAGGGISIGYAGHAELHRLCTSIAGALVQLAVNPKSLGQPHPAAYAPYEASAIARRFSEVFENVRTRTMA